MILSKVLSVGDHNDFSKMLSVDDHNDFKQSVVSGRP